MVNGVTLQYVEQGAGEPVVLVHGAISDRRVWNGQIPALSEEFQAIAYTQRYFGNQPWPDKGEQFSNTVQAADLAAFVQALDHGPVHVVAWSSGGDIALLAAVEHPELFRSLVLYEPAMVNALLTTEDEKAADDLLNAALGPAFEVAANGDIPGGVEQFLDAIWEKPGAFDQLSPEGKASLVDSGRTMNLDWLPTGVTCEQLRKIEMPTLVLVGAETSFQYFSIEADGVAECIPHAERASIPGATHGGPMLQAGAVNAAIIDFLEAH